MSDTPDTANAFLTPDGYAALGSAARARQWGKQANAAEWAATDSPYGGLILQQRRRARSANARAFWVLVMLFAVVVLGLAYYIAPDLLERFSDGRRAAAQEGVDLADIESRALNDTRERIREELWAALDFAIEPMESPTTDDLQRVLMLQDTGTLIALGSRGTVLRSTDRGESWAEIGSGTDRGFRSVHITEATGTLLAVTVRGEVLRFSDDGATVSLKAINIPEPNRLYLVEMPRTGTLLLRDASGVSWRSVDDGMTWSSVDGTANWKSTAHAVSRSTNTIIVVGYDGSILRSVDDGKTWGRSSEHTGTRFASVRNVSSTNTWIATGTFGELFRSTNDGVKWVRQDVNAHRELRFFDSSDDVGAILVGDDNGSLFLSRDDGASWLRTKFDPQEYQFDLKRVEATGTLIAVRADREIMRSTDDGTTWNPTGASLGLRPHLFWEIRETGTLFLVDNEGAFLRSINDGRTWVKPANLAFPSNYLPGVVHAPDGMFLRNLQFRGSGASMYRSTDNGDTWSRLATGTESTIHDATAIDGAGGLVAVGDKGIILLGGDRYRRMMNGLTDSRGDIADEISGDRALAAFFSGLPEHLKTFGIFSELGSRLGVLVAEREKIDQARAAARKRLDELGTPVLQDRERQKAFAVFMNTCRAASSQVESIVSCAAAWTADQKAARKGWWETLAQQAPVGILLIFLLALLGGLYRYSLRMAGFYASRADALELLAGDMAKHDVDKLERLANTLAADKVEFRDSRTPADQAVEIAKAINARA